MGMAPIGWRDIEAWQSCVGIGLPPWQARALMDMSREYSAFSRLAEKPDCPSPTSEEAMGESRRDQVARALKIGLRAMMSKN
jgi:hypothetical protein